MNEEKHENQTGVDVPVAVTTRPATLMQVGRFSGMWWVTLASLLLAIGLVWWSLPEDGIEVTVRFPQGHGLQAEDQVLYRGIEVGSVTGVELNKNLSSVDVRLRLNASASELAREGTRFWIVRPQLSLSGITGLETAVGHKYVSLSPGPVDGKRVYVFDGLIDPPPQDASSPSVEIVVRGDKRYSVSPGSTVTFRGVVVGRVLSVNLSQDSRYVDVRAKIFEKYAQNLTTASRFWATSGINFDFSLTEGLKFDSESLSSIAQGGISFLTIKNDGDHVSPGHVFKLYSRPEDEWLVAADSVSSTRIDLGGVVKLQKRWKQRSLIGQRIRTSLINGVPVQKQSGERVIFVPMSATEYPEKAIDGTRELVVNRTGGVQTISCEDAAIVATDFDHTLGVFVWQDLDGIGWLSPSDFRVPTETESVFAVRANMEDADVTYLHYPIEKAYLRADWSLPQFDGDPEVWDGAVVLSADDGKVVGVLNATDQQARVVVAVEKMFK